jgi:hypothetical protein
VRPPLGTIGVRVPLPSSKRAAFARSNHERAPGLLGSGGIAPRFSGSVEYWLKSERVEVAESLTIGERISSQALSAAAEDAM